MGLFGFGKKEIRPMEQSFTEYTETDEGCPVFVSCDLNMSRVFPTKEYPVCIKIKMDVYLKDAENGLISDAELAQVNMIKSLVFDRVEGFCAGTGIICSKGIAFMLFYVSEKSAKQSKDVLSNTFSSAFRKVDVEYIDDPNGNQYYQFVYPDAFQMKKLENIKLLQKLKTYGDDGTKSRPVIFTLIFSGKESTVNYVKDSTKLGYMYVNTIPEEIPGRVLPQFRLEVSYEMPFDPDKLNIKIRELTELADTYGGEYKSLRTDVIK